MAVKVLATLMAGVDGRRELLATWHVVSVATVAPPLLPAAPCLPTRPSFSFEDRAQLHVLHVLEYIYAVSSPMSEEKTWWCGAGLPIYVHAFLRCTTHMYINNVYAGCAAGGWAA